MNAPKGTPFKKGNSGKPKGAKNRSTRIKEAVGVENWEQLKEYVESKGVQKCIQELQKQKGGRFIYAFLALTEFVKPKLTRMKVEGDKDNPIHVTIEL